MKSGNGGLQGKIDRMKYPPTHTFRVKDLEPTDRLKERFEIFEEMAPRFFHEVGTFLDVGCNKGFFSAYLSQFPGNRVVGIDPDPKYFEILREFEKGRSNLSFLNVGFRDFISEENFDRVLLGNVHHYIFRECHSWDWIFKLAVLTHPGSQVLIEGPLSMACHDMKGFLPKELESRFNYGELDKIMSEFFTVTNFQASISYTPERYVMLLLRREHPIDRSFDLQDYPCEDLIKAKHEPGFGDVYRSRGRICKVFRPLYNSPGYFRNRIAMASLSPVSNGLLGFLYDESRVAGWIEEEFRRRPFRYFEEERKIFKLYCLHQIFLSRNGYFDIDSATINYVRTGWRRKIELFDKCSVYPIRDIRFRHWKAPRGISDIREVYFVMLRNSYRRIGREVQDLIDKAMASNQSGKVEEAFRKIREEIL